MIQGSRLDINEIFHSLQGEGPFSGQPATFIRLGGCLEPYCDWCDTRRAWHEHAPMEIAEIISHIQKHQLVVITGGEPFLQWQTGLSELHQQLVSDGCRIQYETSGKCPIPDLKDGLIVMSPKLIDSCWHCSDQNIRRADYLKFVAYSQLDLHEIHNYITQHHIPADRVFIMPGGQTRQEQLENMPAVFTFCSAMGYNLSARLHILAFDSQAGI